MAGVLAKSQLKVQQFLLIGYEGQVISGENFHEFSVRFLASNCAGSDRAHVKGLREAWQ
jgi:hypothetical protein